MDSVLYLLLTLVTSVCYDVSMNNHIKGGKKRWEKVGTEERSKQMKKIRGSLDFSKIKLPHKPKDIKEDILEEISNETEKGMEKAILLSLSDGKLRTKKEIATLVERITLVATMELLRRKGIMEVSDDFDWFTNWKARQKEMICPRCEYRWRNKKSDKGKCPKCGVDLIKLAEKIFPKLKK